MAGTYCAPTSRRPRRIRRRRELGSAGNVAVCLGISHMGETHTSNAVHHVSCRTLHSARNMRRCCSCSLRNSKGSSRSCLRSATTRLGAHTHPAFLMLFDQAFSQPHSHTATQPHTHTAPHIHTHISSLAPTAIPQLCRVSVPGGPLQLQHARCPSVQGRC